MAVSIKGGVLFVAVFIKRALLFGVSIRAPDVWKLPYICDQRERRFEVPLLSAQDQEGRFPGRSTGALGMLGVWDLVFADTLVLWDLSREE